MFRWRTARSRKHSTCCRCTPNTLASSFPARVDSSPALQRVKQSANAQHPPTIPYFMRERKPMLPTRTLPVWISHLTDLKSLEKPCKGSQKALRLMFTSGRPFSAHQSLIRRRAANILSAASTAVMGWLSLYNGAP